MKSIHLLHTVKKCARVLPLLVAVLTTGCASVGGYVTDRVHDAGDIANVTIGFGEGGGVRLGPVALGLGGYGDMVGLRRGVVGTFDARKRYDVFMLLYGWEVFGDKRAESRGKDFNFPESKKFVRTPSYYAHMTQIEVAGGLLAGARIGFNPAELLDFLLGWFTLDILNDDLTRRKKEPPAPQK